MSHRKYLQERFSLAFSQTLGAFDKNIAKLFLGAVLLGLGVFFYWYVKGWPEASEEFATLIIVSIAPAFLMFFLLLTLNFSFYSPYTLHAQLSEKLAKTSDITIQQVRGHEDKVQSTYSTADSWFVLIRNLALVNHNDKDDVVSIKLCWLLNRKNVLDFPPQTTRPAIKDIGEVSLLKGVENIPSRNAVPGSVLFKIPKSTVRIVSAPFYIIVVTSQLTGIERAYNSADFTEVRKPYPRTYDELREQRESSNL